MAKDSRKPKEVTVKAHCMHCAEPFTIKVELSGKVSRVQTHCPRCGVRIIIPIANEIDDSQKELQADAFDIHVFGKVASEVEVVSKALIKEIEMSKRKNNSRSRNPWISGSFYLAVAIIIGTLILVIAKNVSAVALPIVIIGTLLIVSVVGAFQLRQDSSLSEKNFLSLMLMTFRQIPFIRSNDKTPKKR
jgi:DNA-directed RNA polymerase subunit RPC12/RpoP